MYDHDDDARHPGAMVITEREVVGLYPPDAAAVAARTTMTDQGSGNWRTDD